MTFSIVGYCPKEKEWGIAVQSKFLAVGAVVPFAKAGVGAIATQSYANTTYGPRALELFVEGKTAEEAMQIMIGDDQDHHLRQVGLIDSHGNSTTYTGEGSYQWAGGVIGTHFAAQGNILVDAKTVEAMAEIFTNSEGTLAERLLAALAAGQEAGGDSRGQQSAALLVVKDKGGYAGFNDRYIDLRVDDHTEPIKELIRIYHLQQLYFARTKPESVTIIEGQLKEELYANLERLGYLSDGDDLLQALKTYIHTENFENREQQSGYIDIEILEYMKKQ
ncbi:MAG TPA: DUF1028 domain-containing protein [Pseudoneobacillus sp.]|nr:DUF1028 domain-containing protein [Pseudoneobacillus sp.]